MKRTTWLLFAAAFAGMMVGFFHVTSSAKSNKLTRQHASACAEQGLPNDGCCRVGRAWVCPVSTEESNHE